MHQQLQIHPQAKRSLIRLLGDSLETYYWIGFIDGDGNIDMNNPTIRLGVDSTWLPLLQQWYDKLHLALNIKPDKSIAKIQVDNSARLNICTLSTLKTLAKFAQDNSLPFMERK